MLKSTADFQRLARNGKRWSGSVLMLQATPATDSDLFRCGLTASRKVGGAVVRNRAKRRLRETIRALVRAHDIKGWDVVVIARTASATCAFELLQQEAVNGFKKLGILS